MFEKSQFKIYIKIAKVYCFSILKFRILVHFEKCYRDIVRREYKRIRCNSISIICRVSVQISLKFTFGKNQESKNIFCSLMLKVSKAVIF